VSVFGRIERAGARIVANVRRTPLVRDAARDFYFHVKTSMRRILFAFLVMSVLVTPTPAFAQISSSAEAQRLLDDLSPEERVGQLFLVSFYGTQATENTQIYDLIVNHHIGGVVLLAGNDNFNVAPNTVLDAYTLIAQLQKAEWDSSTKSYVDPLTGLQLQRSYIPLLVGISRDGTTTASNQILNGMTPIASPMALGATWNPQLARDTGTVLGRELSAIGFNLLLGPSLDVMEVPDPTGAGDLATRAFGGDPYWVGEMGRAYIGGLHAGSDGRLLLIAKHFPGRGSSDRPPEEEVPTVRKSLEQLKQIELAPFFAVTGSAPSPDMMTDGLLVSHIRYQGFQGNIRATTRPISFDAQALNQIMGLPQLTTWRQNGGLMVSDDLGSKAVRQFYDPGNTGFTVRLVARDAFLAGNDLIYLGNAVSSDATDNYTTVVRALEFFAQKYREDSAFAQRVDESVLRILSRKLAIYPQFTYNAVLSPEGGLTSVGQSSQVTFDAARASATLISPDLADLDIVLPEPPASTDRLVFLTDVNMTRQCSACPEQPELGVTALSDAILRLYGPNAGGQVYANHLTSYSFFDLKNLLDGQPTDLDGDFTRSNWVIISLTGNSSGQAALVRRFLSERQDALRSKHVILFAFSAPYYLDATDISKINVYYGLYSTQQPFVDVAARILYRELSPAGASPVSIPGIGYDLITAMSPDPAQVLTLSLDLPQQAATATPADSTQTPEPTEVPLFRAGDTIPVRTGVILDHNGHPVPDGTVVRFRLDLTGEGGGTLQQVDTVTTQGVARASFRLDKSGVIEIRVSSEPAQVSDILQLDVSTDGSASVTLIAPVPTDTPEPAPVTPVATEPPSAFVTPEGYPRAGAWVLAVLLIAAGTWLAYQAGANLYDRRHGLRWALCVLVGGALVYTYLSFGLPGGPELVASGGLLTVLVLTFLGELLGLGCAYAWGLAAQRSQKADHQ
jgi:beta-N-acetylhexosaminidase